MIATWIVQFKTGYELKDGELARIKDLIALELGELATEYMASMIVAQSYFIPGPMTVKEP